MFIDTLDAALAHRPHRSRPRLASLAAWLLALSPVAPRRLPVDDLPDRDLADLRLRRGEVTNIDPREPRLF